MGRAVKADTPQKGGHLVSASTMPAPATASIQSTTPRPISNASDRVLQDLVELDVHNTAQPSLATSWEAEAGCGGLGRQAAQGRHLSQWKGDGGADVIYFHRPPSRQGSQIGREGARWSRSPSSPRRINTSSPSPSARAMPTFPISSPTTIWGSCRTARPTTKASAPAPSSSRVFEPGQRALTKRNPNYWNPDRGFVNSVETLAINDPTARMRPCRAARSIWSTG